METPISPQGPRLTGIKAYLAEILYGMGEAAKKHAGLPTDKEIREQEEEINNLMIEADNTRFYTESNGLHSAPSAMAVEFETADFLYGLVRMLKPRVILETGCGEGHSTKAMARASKDNGIGFVYSCDTDPMMCAATCSTEELLACHGGVQNISGEALCLKITDIDLAFLDSSGDRVAECAALHLSPKGVVVLHDSKRAEYKPIWTMRPWASIWEIDTPRGLTVFQS